MFSVKNTIIIPYTPPKTPIEFVRSEVEKFLLNKIEFVNQIPEVISDLDKRRERFKRLSNFDGKPKVLLYVSPPNFFPKLPLQLSTLELFDFRHFRSSRSFTSLDNPKDT